MSTHSFKRSVKVTLRGLDRLPNLTTPERGGLPPRDVEKKIEPKDHSLSNRDIFLGGVNTYIYIVNI